MKLIADIKFYVDPCQYIFGQFVTQIKFFKACGWSLNASTTSILIIIEDPKTFRFI